MPNSLAWLALLAAISTPSAQALGSLELAAAEGMPSEEITLPLFFKSEAESPVGRLRAELRYPAEALAFLRIEDASVTKRLQVDIQEDDAAAPGEATKPDRRDRLLQVDVRARTGALPTGVLGYLVFAVQPGARVTETYRVALEAAAIDADGAARELPVKPGQVTIARAPSLFACFFYMH